jgi:glycerol-3-phosphate acyltransferase PlsX
VWVGRLLMAGPSPAVIALDAMGGDGAPGVCVQGALEALTELQIPILLVGPLRRLRRELGLFRTLPDGLELVDAPESVSMDEAPLAAVRDKPRSSLVVCAELVASGRAAAMVTAGNTGAAWLTARAVLGTIDGVDRPALAAILPRVKGHTLLLDVGANLECRPSHLVQFAVMGSYYAEAVLGVREPRVGLMSVGEEESKGGRKGREQHRVLASTGIRFVGNVEGRDVFTGDADVIVCDGFTGNVILKAAEGLGELVISVLREEARRSPMYGAGLLMAKGAFLSLRQKVDYSETGAAPLLGVGGACLIGHGRSNSRAIRNAVRYAASYAASDVIRRIGEKIRDGYAIPSAKGVT